MRASACKVLIGAFVAALALAAVDARHGVVPAASAGTLRFHASQPLSIYQWVDFSYQRYLVTALGQNMCAGVRSLCFVIGCALVQKNVDAPVPAILVSFVRCDHVRGVDSYQCNLSLSLLASLSSLLSSAFPSVLFSALRKGRSRALPTKCK